MRFPQQLELPPTTDRWLSLKNMWMRAARAVNGGISFGDGSKIDNIDGTWVNVTSPVAPDTDFTVAHHLDRLPVGYLVMSKSASCDVYTGSIAATEDQITLRASVGAVNLRLFIILFLLVLLPHNAKAQAVVFHDIATYNSSGTVKVIPSANITVCPGSSALVAPCTPATVPLYKDVGLTQPLSNPFQGDVNGNFTFWVLTGNYVVSITGSGVQGYSYAITPGGGVGALPGALFRIQPVLGTALSSSDFALTGWGAGAAISNVQGTDTAFSLTVTAGTGASVNPTVKLTFKDGPWSTINTVNAEWNGTTDVSDISYTTDLATLTLTFLATPINGLAYSFNVVVMGNSNVTSLPVAVNPVIINPGGIQVIAGYPLVVPQLDTTNFDTPGNPASGRVRVYSKTDNKLYYRTAAGVENLIATGTAAGGTVTSVALTMPADLFNISGSPINTAGTFIATKANVSAGLVYAGPPTGGAAAPNWKNLTTDFLPFTYTGNTATLATCTGSFTAGHFLSIDANGNCVDSTLAAPTLRQWGSCAGGGCTTCPTSGSSFDTCTYTITWGTSFGGTTYKVLCQGLTPFDADNGDAGRLIPNGVSSKTATQVVFKISSAGASHVSYSGGVTCYGEL